MENFIIGIAGAKNSGKDTLASMLNYIFSVGITSASYREWITNRVRYEITYKDIILHFADSLKDVLSIMYHIDRKHFDDRKFKDELWYNITDHEFITDKESYDYNMIKYTVADFELHPLSYYVDNPNNKVLIKLRTLLQYFGTNLCRDNLSKNLWVNNTIRVAEFTSELRGRCFIADIRFKEEADAIKSSKPFTGEIIHIIRDNSITAEHVSEDITFKCDKIIYNDGSLLQLFYKAIQYVQQLKNI